MDISYSCCECVPSGSRSCFEERGFFDKELHISNIKKREDFAKIFDSKGWKNFDLHYLKILRTRYTSVKFSVKNLNKKLRVMVKSKGFV